MTAQLLPDLVYAAILVIALLMPYATWGERGKIGDRWIIGAIFGCAILLTAARHVGLTIFSLVLLLPLLRMGPRPLLGGVSALLLFAAVTWWSPTGQITGAAAVLFILLGAGAAYLPRLGAAPTEKKRSPAILPPMGIAFLIGIGVGLLTAPFGSREPLYFAWHHWGAYLSPVEAWLAGGLPYRDFPIQYGIGPTALLAATCGSDCWRGTYWVTIVADALYFAVLAGCVVILTAAKSRGVRWLALVALWCASFIWTAFPFDVGSTAMTPSVAGLRFLPIALLLLHILSAESSCRRRDWLGHAIWLFDMFWSPEAAFFGTLIWWPYLALRDAADAPTSRQSWIALFRGALRGLVAFAVGAIAVAAVLWLLSAGAARPKDFLAYILYPPGPLSINPVGAIWLALAVILVSFQGLAGSGRSMQGRALYACLLGFLAAGTYYLSRSHDNNILNLFPLLVVLLIACAQIDRPANAPPAFRDAFVCTVLAAMVAFIATARWTSWTQGGSTEGLLNIGPSRMLARFTAERGTQPAVLPPDALNGLAYLRDHKAGAVVLIDDNGLIQRDSAGQGWTSVNNYANFEPLPLAMIRRFACRGAMTYRRPGWILIDQRKSRFWIAAFEGGYEVRERLRFGAYRAYHLFPRSGTLSCAEL